MRVIFNTINDLVSSEVNSMVTSYSQADITVDLTINEPTTPRSITPMLSFIFTFINRSEVRIRLSGFNFKFNILSKEGGIYHSTFFSFELSQLELPRNQRLSMPGYVVLDYYMIKKIEELRANGDVNFLIYGNFVETHLKAQTLASTQLASQQTKVRISKSDWIEKVLPAFDYKEVILVEIPKLNAKEYENVIQHLNSAWKQKHMGQYDKVLTDCRLSVEALRDIVKSKGYTNEELERKDKLDWNTYFNSPSFGDIFSKIDQQIYRLTSTAAHPGKSINLEDADYALLITHAIVNMALKKRQ